MAADREAPIDPIDHLRMLPVVTVTAPGLVPAIRAGAIRAGAGVYVIELEEAGDAALLRARAAGGEVVISLEDGPSSPQVLGAASRLGGRGIPVLGLAADGDLARVLPTAIALLTDPHLRDINVAVPSTEDDLRRRHLWDQLRAAHVEDRHHLVEVDGAPALEELRALGEVTPDDAWAGLAAGAAGVLAGRIAASNRRWRR